MQYEPQTEISNDIVFDEEMEAVAGFLIAEKEQPFVEMRELLRIVGAAKNASELLGYSPVNRGAREEAIERPISGAYYASLASYRRDENPQHHFNGFLVSADKHGLQTLDPLPVQLVVHEAEEVDELVHPRRDVIDRYPAGDHRCRVEVLHLHVLQLARGTLQLQPLLFRHVPHVSLLLLLTEVYTER